MQSIAALTVNAFAGRIDDDPDPVALCPACGDLPDYCSGHGPIGDPVGYRILTRHDNGDHRDCHPVAHCEE